MRPDCVVVAPPAFDDDPRLLQRVEYLIVEQRIAYPWQPAGIPHGRLRYL
jgi:hypothetical protein